MEISVPQITSLLDADLPPAGLGAVKAEDIFTAAQQLPTQQIRWQ